MMNEDKSKSQRKREAHDLQDFGAKLVSLSLTKLEKLPLPDQLRRAVMEARALKSYGAIKRQTMYIGKLLRAYEPDEQLLAAYEQLEADENSQTAEFHVVEQWRSRLMDEREGKDALTAYIGEHPLVDVQHLRQLIKKAVDEQKKGANLGGSRALFRYLREYR